MEKAVIPNRDFAISYRSAGDQITDAVLTHTDERGKLPYVPCLPQPRSVLSVPARCPVKRGLGMLDPCFGEAFGHFGLLQAGGDLGEIAGHDAGEVVRGETDAMVGDA